MLVKQWFAKRVVASVFVASCLMWSSGCSGGAGIGQPCDSVGSADECVTNAVCTDEPGGNVCAEICDEDTDCPSSQHCDSVPGSSVDTCQAR